LGTRKKNQAAKDTQSWDCCARGQGVGGSQRNWGGGKKRNTGAEKEGQNATQQELGGKMKSNNELKRVFRGKGGKTP